MPSYEFNLLPVPKPRQTRSDKWKKRPRVVAYRAFADELRKQASEQGFKLCNGLYYEFHLPIAKSHSRNKKVAMVGRLHDQRPDLDNLLKAFWDALLEEDKAIGSIAGARKIWAFSPKIIIITKL